MAMNRVQFRPGLTMHKCMELDGIHDECEVAVIGWRWPKDYICLSCGQAGVRFSSFRPGSLLYLQCGSCHFQCSVIAGTLFEATKLPLTVWFPAMHRLSRARANISMLGLSRQLEVSHPSGWLMKHKLIEVMQLREDCRQLSSTDGLDAGYLGGQRSGGKVGRGSENKAPFVTAVQATESGEAQLVCLVQLPFNKEPIKAFVDKSLVRPLTVASDSLACFTVTAKAGVHDRIAVSAGNPSAAHARFNAVGTAQSILKTAMSGAYRSVKFAKYAHRYLARFQYRFNRRFDMRAIFARLACVAGGAQLRNRQLLRVAEVGCY